ncbi:MAG: aminotransferase class IV [Alistipes sp.]|nr:aminotransferase class IV [Alistipes sp.]
MADSIILGRTLTDAPPAAPDEAFVYQHIHVRSLRPAALAAHVAVAGEASQQLFGFGFDADAAAMDALCRRMLLRNRYPSGVSSCITLRIYSGGESRWTCGEIFVCDGFVLRPLRPEATLVSYDIPFGELPSSARSAMHLLALSDARRRGFRSVVRCDSRGRVLTADDSPVFVVRGRTVYTPDTFRSVEGMRAAAALHHAGYELVQTDIAAGALRDADEIFLCDCRGITALGSLDGRPLADIIARAAARALAAASRR